MVLAVNPVSTLAAPIASAIPVAKPASVPKDNLATTFTPVIETEETQKKPAQDSRVNDDDRALKERERIGENKQRSDQKRSAKKNEQQQQQQDQQQIGELAKRDREVRAHEAAHAAVGGQYAGAPQLTFTRGPNGQLYATSGEVGIDASSVPGDPEATLRKLQTVRQAALAPVEPSAQDRSVAAQASTLIAQAQAEISAQVNDERNAEPKVEGAAADKNSEENTVETNSKEETSAEQAEREKMERLAKENAERQQQLLLQSSNLLDELIELGVIKEDVDSDGELNPFGSVSISV